MKKNKLLFCVFLSAAVILLLASCGEEGKDKDEDKGVSPYLGETLTIVGQQVYEPNRYTTKVSNVYLSYGGSREIDIAITVPFNSSYISKLVASGTVINGILDFVIGDEIKNNLVGWDNLKYLIPALMEWKNVTISPADIKGNYIYFFAYPLGGDGSEYGVLTREVITGTSSTITNEKIIYVYVDNDCAITGEANTGYVHGKYYYYTEGALNLSLKRGWNMIMSRETYGKDFDGNANISLEVRNPIKTPEDYKWVFYH